MIIVSLADAKYKERLLVQMRQSQKFGYDTLPYDMGGLGFGKCWNISKDVDSVDVRAKSKICMSKPAILLDAFDDDEYNETMVYLDADAFIVKSIDEIDTDDYDIGVTYKGGETKTYVNAGVLFVRQTDKARAFLNLWLAKIACVEHKLKSVNKNQIGDQIFLNDLLFAYVRKGKLLNTVQDVAGVRVKFFDYRDYNNFKLSRASDGVLKKVPKRTKIVHLCNQREEAFHMAVKKWLT